jgi:hypothetical protein
MININDYILEKLHIDKDSRYIPSNIPEKGDYVLVVRMAPSVGNNNYNMWINYGVIAEISIEHNIYKVIVNIIKNNKVCQNDELTMKENSHGNLEQSDKWTNNIILTKNIACEFIKECQKVSQWVEISFNKYFDKVKKPAEVLCAIKSAYTQEINKVFFDDKH